MDTHYKNLDKFFLINFGSADNCFQKQSFLNNQLSQEQQYPIIRQVVQKKKALKRNSTTSLVPLGQPKTTDKSPALRFKMESVGNHPEDDDDLDMCPARVRPSWPSKIIPWWVASYPDEKPPYSYATLIAHAILSSKDGRLTLNDIYSWIADKYSAFSVGTGGWQNSIRHNLSLNKKWFYKIDRRPTQANPGKGCYWTLVAGTEQIFIDNLTQEGGHSRKHHDIGLTADLSISQRRGACYYHNAPITIVTPGHTQPLQGTSNVDSNNINGLTTPPPAPIKIDLPKPLLSPLYTTFKMVNMAGKPQQQQQSENVELLDDSDNDSGVDVSNNFVDTKHFRKRRRTTSNKNCSVSASKPSMQSTKHVDTSMIYDTPTSTSVASFDLASTSSSKVNNWVTKHSSPCSENLLFDNIQHDQCQWSSSYVTPNLADDSWCESTVVPPTSSFVNNITLINNGSRKGQPITINLDNEEITHKYLYLEEDEDDLTFFDEQLASSFNNNISSSMPISNIYINANSNNNTYYTVYPHSPPFSPTEKLANTTSSMNIITPPPLTSTSSLYNYQLQQFVTMQDILYS